MSPDNHVISVPGRMSKETCKLLILGDEGVGKTTLLKRLEKGRFIANVSSTVAVMGGGIVDFVEREYDLDGKKVTLQVWDTAGQEQYDSITTSYFRSAVGYILTYDITKEQTFATGVQRWRRLLEEHATVDPNILLIGTKLDLESEREVQTKKAQDYAESSNISLFFETSAVSGENVEKSFEAFLREMYVPKEQMKGDASMRFGLKSTPQQNPSRSGCQC